MGVCLLVLAASTEDTLDSVLYVISNRKVIALHELEVSYPRLSIAVGELRAGSFEEINEAHDAEDELDDIATKHEKEESEDLQTHVPPFFQCLEADVRSSHNRMHVGVEQAPRRERERVSAGREKNNQARKQYQVGQLSTSMMYRMMEEQLILLLDCVIFLAGATDIDRSLHSSSYPPQRAPDNGSDIHIRRDELTQRARKELFFCLVVVSTLKEIASIEGAHG